MFICVQSQIQCIMFCFKQRVSLGGVADERARRDGTTYELPPSFGFAARVRGRNRGPAAPFAGARAVVAGTGLRNAGLGAPLPGPPQLYTLVIQGRSNERPQLSTLVIQGRSYTEATSVLSCLTKDEAALKQRPHGLLCKQQLGGTSKEVGS
jgi:hypothetical protein